MQTGPSTNASHPVPHLSTTPREFPSGDRIPHPAIWPAEGGGFAIRMMLRIAGEDGFADFHHAIRDGEALLDFLESFRLDPTGTCDTLWGAAGTIRPRAYHCNVFQRQARSAAPERLAAARAFADDLDI